MSWRRLLVSPISPTCWSVDREIVAVLSRNRKGPLSVAHAPLASGLLEIGPVGLQSVNRVGLAEVLRPLQEQVDGHRRAAVIMPMAWVRGHLLDFDDLPRKPHEILDVVRWRLKKLLPVLPTELRLSVVPYPAAERRRALLCMAGLERAFADLEGAFADAGIQPGLITPRLFALATSGDTTAQRRLVIQHESSFLSLLLMVDRRPALLRTKPLPELDDPWPTVARELHLALTFIHETLEVTQPLQVTVSAGGEVEAALALWASEQDGFSVVTTGLPSIDVAGTVSELGAERLAPVHAVLSGGPTA